ncbi:MAG: AAA family ATPase [Chlamydiota bacterium]
MFYRKMELELIEAAKSYPIVTLLGPRQSGKTTLVKKVFPEKPYVNLERLHLRKLAKSDPEGFLQGYPKGAILDEIQAAPLLLSAIQVRVDESKQKGEFILTGSHQMALPQDISQSLAGRTAILHLLPLSLEEFKLAGVVKDLEDLLFEGCYPAVQSEGLSPTKTYANYVATYLERDIRNMMQVHNLGLFEKFLVLIASRIGQMNF